MAVGGITLPLFVVAWLLRARLGLDASEYAVGFVMFHAAHFINDPHFSVTYLLFYKDVHARALGTEHSRAQRARYWIAGVVVPVLLVGWAGTALVLRSALVLGALIQLMFLLVGWHYAKQGFGVLVALSARRGFRFDARERAVLLTHCFAAWAFAWANPARPAGEFEEKGVTYLDSAHPQWVENLTFAVLVLSTLALAFVLVSRMRRDRSFPYAPLGAFLVTIWLWTIYTALDPLVRYVIPALHSIQYLYFVWLLRSNEARAQEGPPHFGPPMATRLGALALSALVLGWALFHGVPDVLDASVVAGWSRTDATESLGPTPFFAAFYVVVNIHHYFMDSVIWRRDNPEMRYLRVAEE